MGERQIIETCARSVASIAPAVIGLEAHGAHSDVCAAAVKRGHFTPAEEDTLRGWFARYLTARAGLLETIDELTPIAKAEPGTVDDETQVRAFVVGYTAAALLIRAARHFVTKIANHKIIQRKLNEPSVACRYPRKQYTHIYHSMTSPANAWRLNEAMRFADEHRTVIHALHGDALLGPVVDALEQAEGSLRVGVEKYVRARLRYRWHSWRRRRASAFQQSLFWIAEAFGRVIAEVSNPYHTTRATRGVRAELSRLLRPGDILIARHDQHLSNLFLPGYWPHAALHIGPPKTRSRFNLRLHDRHVERWVEPLSVLEAKKDGVLFRPAEETLDLDALAVLRPRLGESEIAEALSNAIAHEGKLYNFDFDFFTDDRLVCTEVVYRAYEGVGGISIPLQECFGRRTLPAENLISMALEGGIFEPVIAFGTPTVGTKIVKDAEAVAALRAIREEAGA